MDCPKCNSAMQELKIETLHGQVVIDKCESCSGLWFDNGEAEQLKGDWMAEFADSVTRKWANPTIMSGISSAALRENHEKTQ